MIPALEADLAFSAAMPPYSQSPTMTHAQRKRECSSEPRGSLCTSEPPEKRMKMVSDVRRSSEESTTSSGCQDGIRRSFDSSAGIRSSDYPAATAWSSDCPAGIKRSSDCPAGIRRSSDCPAGIRQSYDCSAARRQSSDCQPPKMLWSTSEVKCASRLTRQHSRELKRILRKPHKDPRKIHNHLDPSIFDAELSGSDGEELPELEPVLQEEIEEYIQPWSLDIYSYKESQEFEQSESEELPDLDLAFEDDDTASNSEQTKLHAHRPDLFETMTSSLGIPKESLMEDKLSMEPKVILRRLEDAVDNLCKPQIKLKLNPGNIAEEGQRLASKKIHMGRLKSICDQVLLEHRQRVPASSAQCQSDSDDSDSEDHDSKQESQSSNSGSGRVVTATTQNISTEQSDHIQICRHARFQLSAPIHAILKHETKASKELHSILASLIENVDLDGEQFQLCYLNMCAKNSSPSSHYTATIVKQLFEILLNSASTLVAWKAYNLLNQSLYAHPAASSLPIDWQNIEEIIARLKLSHGIKNCEPGEIFAPSLCLQYIVSAIEIELLHQAAGESSPEKLVRPSHRHLAKSLAYQWLSAERGFCRIRQLIDWTVSAVSYGQHGTSGTATPQHYTPRHSPTDHNANRRRTGRPTPALSHSQVPQVLPLLQKLLSVALSVSRRGDCAQRIASMMGKSFIHVPVMAHRHLLVSTIESPLLKYKLTQRILEDYGHSSSYGCDNVTVSLHDLVMTYSSYEPPMTALTPPLSPMDDGSLEGSSHPCHLSKYSPDSVEELAYLLYFLLTSYLKITNVENDRETLKDMKTHVDSLRTRFQELTSELTPKTQLYLEMINGLQCLV